LENTLDTDGGHRTQNKKHHYFTIGISHMTLFHSLFCSVN
jgi:hypothetical protein